MHLSVIVSVMLLAMTSSTSVRDSYRDNEPSRENLHGYRTLRGHGAYKVHKQLLSWKNAWKECTLEGAHLAVLETNEEALAIQRLVNRQVDLSTYHDPYASIGFHSLFAESYWTTIFGLPLDQFYSNWSRYQPDNFGSIEFCGGINKEVELVDIPCEGFFYPFVCEKREKSEE